MQALLQNGVFPSPVTNRNRKSISVVHGTDTLHSAGSCAASCVSNGVWLRHVKRLSMHTIESQAHRRLSMTLHRISSLATPNSFAEVCAIGIVTI